VSVAAPGGYGVPTTHEGAPPKAKLLSEQAPQPGAGQAGSDQDLVAALNAIVLAGASDLHVGVNAPPMMRVDGGLKPIPGMPVWDSAKVDFALRSVMSAQHQVIFAEALELDFAYTLSETSRFRVNVYQQRASLGAAFRLIPTEIKQLGSLGIPDKVSKFAQLPRGLVLVTGPTGSGKSTTLAALIDLVNSTRADHIVTVEDPIEFLHANKKSIVNQREVGHDTHSFNNALKHVLRQDPDVILIGELRDLETISVALTAAETGHLVFATLHTQDAAQTIDRVIDVFPPHQQGQVRAQLAATLQGVVCQTLVKKAGGGGRAVATEVLVTTPAVANLIREGKTYQIHSVMQAGRDLGMHTMDQHLADLVNAGQISHQAAYDKAHDLEDLKHLIQRAGRDSSDSVDSSRKPAGIDFGDAYSSQGA
jgi:twitching motility protein PilT